jgi:DNA-binding NarL/FixJ family response regulator
MSLRILIVDDYAAWRRYVSVKLQNDLRYRVIGEVTDGLQALQAAESLKPDLVLLDIGLPKINGIEVARRLLAGAPQSRVLFLSENQLPEIAESALNTGAYGYVVKSDAASDLVPAIAAIADGKTFVSPRFAGHAIAWRTIPRKSEKIRHHDVFFSSDESSLVDGFAQFVAGTLTSGGSAILLATPAHRRAVYEQLQAGSTEIDIAVAQRRYVPLDVDETLSAFMVDDWPDEARFPCAATALIAAAAAAAKGPYPHVAACGEAASQLCAKGNAGAAIRFEQLWDDLGAKLGVDILCGYSQHAIRSDERRIVSEVSAVHSTACWR